MSKVKAEELALLPEILKRRLEFFQTDPKFKGMDGTEVRSCIVAALIYNEFPCRGIDIAFARMVKKQTVKLSFPITEEIREMAFRLVDAILHDNLAGMDANKFEKEKLLTSTTMRIHCAAYYRIGVQGCVCSPFDECLKHFVEALPQEADLIV